MLAGAAVCGLPIALIATRTLVATAAAAAVLVLGAVAYLWDQSTLGWAVLLALVAVADRVLDPLEERLVGAFVGARPELE